MDEALGFFEIFVGAQRGDDLDQGVHGGGEMPVGRSRRRRWAERDEGLAQGADGLEPRLRSSRKLLGRLRSGAQLANVEFQGAHYVQGAGGDREGGLPIGSRRQADRGGSGLSAGRSETGGSGRGQEGAPRGAAPLPWAHEGVRRKRRRLPRPEATMAWPP